MIAVKAVQYVGGGQAIPTTTVTLEINGEEYKNAGTGNGLIDAGCNAVKKIICEHFPQIILPIVYNHFSFASTPGTNSVAHAFILVRHNGFNLFGEGSDTDTVRAAIAAYVDSINQVQKVI